MALFCRVVGDYIPLRATPQHFSPTWSPSHSYIKVKLGSCLRAPNSQNTYHKFNSIGVRFSPCLVISVECNLVNELLAPSLVGSGFDIIKLYFHYVFVYYPYPSWERSKGIGLRENLEGVLANLRSIWVQMKAAQGGVLGAAWRNFAKYYAPLFRPRYKWYPSLGS